MEGRKELNSDIETGRSIFTKDVTEMEVHAKNCTKKSQHLTKS
jgi:hypothetical protein